MPPSGNQYQFSVAFQVSRYIQVVWLGVTQNVNTMGPACTTSYPIGISALEKQNIVGIHNDYRRRVASGQEPRGSTGAQPSASNMREMVNNCPLRLTLPLGIINEIEYRCSIGMRSWQTWRRPTPISAFSGTILTEIFVSIGIIWYDTIVIPYLIQFWWVRTARGAVGQNIAIQLRSSGAFTSADWTGRIAAWYNEVDAMVNSYIDSFP